MKITRFTQSCLLIEEGNSKILIDPSGAEKGNVAKFGKLDAILYTHEHADHFDAEMAKSWVEQGVPVYANASTAKLIGGKVNTIQDGQEFSVGGFKIKALELPHCLMWDGGEGPQNTGYLINGQFFHPGDGKELEGLKVDNMALPITGPDVSIKDAFSFAVQLGVKAAIPIHYDYIGTKPEVFASIASGHFDFEVKVLANGASTDL